MLDTSEHDSLFSTYAANAWRAVHLARLALPKNKGDHSFHMTAKDWVYALTNCVEQWSAPQFARQMGA